MKAVVKSRRFAIFLLLLLIVSFMLTQTQLSNFLYTAPWWIHVVMVGIVISGFLSLKYSLQDKQFDDEWIEKEGEVYIERMEKERKKKERSNK